MKITVGGVLIFLVLIVGFFVWLGRPVRLPEGTILSQHRVDKAWLYCALLFVAGAGTASFGEKEYGMFPPTSLRWLFIVFGTLIMVASATWMHSLRTSAGNDEEYSARAVSLTRVAIFAAPKVQLPRILSGFR